MLKGILYNNEGNYKEALQQYIYALKLNNDKNEEQLYYIKKLIAILKTATEDYKEALPLFLEFYNYESSIVNKSNQNVNDYLASIFSVANIYSKLGLFQESNKYIDLGLIKGKKYNSYSNYNYFLMIKGINQFYLKDFNESSKTLSIALKGLAKNKDHVNTSILYFYLGKTQAALNDQAKAINYFIKADSISFAYKSFEPIKRSGYEYLIDFYKKENDYEKQLYYINRLLYIDSVISNDRRHLAKEIIKRYDAPLLLKEKEGVIKKLNNKNNVFLWMILMLLAIVFSSLVIIRRSKNKIKEYKQQARLLTENNHETHQLEQNKVESSESAVSFAGNKPTYQVTRDPKFQSLIDKIEMFEAKELHTNRDYLSKLINQLKGKNFSQYLNELRITYVVEELKNNRVLRKHTIAAIADDIGFNNPESFTNAFKKFTGTLPSYYIKALNENNKL